MQTFIEFLNTDPDCRKINNNRLKNWTYEFDDWEGSLKQIFAVLIYCAQHGKKISYTALGRACNVPTPYLRGSSLGNTMKAILTCIGRYCNQQLHGAPHLTALCVTKADGFPGDGYWDLFNIGGKNLPKSAQKEILLKRFDDLHAYDWAPVQQQLNVNLDTTFLNKLLDQDYFHIQKKRS